MSSFSGLTAKQIETRLKAGRGQGNLQDYKPFLTVRDVSSIGRSHRVFGFKTQRIHHLLSDLELAVFLSFDWSKATIDIREQFPLNTDETARLAQEAGIRHASFKGVHQVMTSDFLINSAEADRPQFAIQVKYAKDLEDKRTIEKLELERRYWHSKRVPWFIVTENNISREAIKNIEWFCPIMNDSVELVDLRRFRSLYESYGSEFPSERLVTIATKIDQDEHLAAGESLYWLRHLLGRRYFLFDISIPYHSLAARDIAQNHAITTLESINAAS